jgi:hypothetical protein
MAASSREALYRAIDELPDESLAELAQFIAYLRYREEHEMDWFYRLQERFEPVRKAADEMSEEEVNQIIDDAISEVRGEREAKSSI